MVNQEIFDFASSLDRSYFIDNENKSLAHMNQPLPIGYGQTISQPSLVVEMSQLLSLDNTKRVLEIGTGSGYQTAILARFSRHVYTIERIPELAQSARKKLEALGITNITYSVGDGSIGWPQYAPYDRIIVTAAAQRMPEGLVGQLAEGGIMILPLGPRDVQELLIVTRKPDGEIRIQSIEHVRFVELRGKYGWSGEDKASNPSDNPSDKP